MQLSILAERGEERTADPGETLYRIGDQEFPFVAILEGEVAILDAAGNEIIRHGDASFLGELNLLSGQSAFVSATATRRTRYIAVDRETLRSMLFEDGPLSDLILSTLIARRDVLQQARDVGLEIIGPRSERSSVEMVEFARNNRLPYIWHDTDRADEAAARDVLTGLAPASRPLVRLPGGAELRGPSPGEVSRALGIGRELAMREQVDVVIVGAGPAGLGAAVYAASEGLQTLVLDSAGLGGQAVRSRRIENYLGFPAGITGSELTSRAVTQARKFNAALATPYRAVALEPGMPRHKVHLRDGQEITARAVLLATGAEYRRLDVENLSDYEGSSIFYAAGPPEAGLAGGARVGVVGGGNSAGQAAVWLTRVGARVTLIHRRADLRETMSEYLVRELLAAGVAIYDHAEIAALHGSDGQIESVSLRTGERLAFSLLFLFLGAQPNTSWLGDSVARDRKGFVLTGTAAGTANLLETSCPGILAVGDVRSGSSKRVATAVGEGAMAVQLIHDYLANGVDARRELTPDRGTRGTG